jgi:hypothetical protein
MDGILMNCHLRNETWFGKRPIEFDQFPIQCSIYRSYSYAWKPKFGSGISQLLELSLMTPEGKIHESRRTVLYFGICRNKRFFILAEQLPWF